MVAVAHVSSARVLVISCWFAPSSLRVGDRVPLVRVTVMVTGSALVRFSVHESIHLALVMFPLTPSLPTLTSPALVLNAGLSLLAPRIVAERSYFPVV